MNATIRDLFAQRANDAGTPDLDIDELVALGEHRLHRRRTTALLGTAAAVAVVIALAVGAGFNGGVERGGGPVDKPVDHSPTTPVRELVYSDVEQGADGLSGSVVHFGDRVVETGSGFVHMDVTDDGFVYLTDENRRLWFSDGGTPEQIGSNVCRDDPGFPGVSVRTANEGSLVAWFDCSGPTHAALVVFDTSLDREIVRRPIARCGVEAPFAGCHPDAVIGEHVYVDQNFFRDGGSGRAASHSLEFDMASGRLTVAHSYLEEVRALPRGLVIGDSWLIGRPTDAIGMPFWVDGSRLVPVDGVWARNPTAATAFDTATQRPVRLHLPRLYPAHHDEFGRGDFWLFEWLDDDTVALVGTTGWEEVPGYGDILTCRLSDGRCDLAVRGHGPVRVVPHLGLPG